MYQNSLAKGPLLETSEGPIRSEKTPIRSEKKPIGSECQYCLRPAKLGKGRSWRAGRLTPGSWAARLMFPVVRVSASRPSPAVVAISYKTRANAEHSSADSDIWFPYRTERQRA